MPPSFDTTMLTSIVWSLFSFCVILLSFFLHSKLRDSERQWSGWKETEARRKEMGAGRRERERAKKSCFEHKQACSTIGLSPANLKSFDFLFAVVCFHLGFLACLHRPILSFSFFELLSFFFPSPSSPTWVLRWRFSRGRLCYDKGRRCGRIS